MFNIMCKKYKIYIGSYKYELICVKTVFSEKKLIDYKVSNVRIDWEWIS